MILIDVEGNRQAAEIVLPNKLTWRASMEKVDKALLTPYTDVLPHELLGEVEWVKDDSILYHPKVTAVNASVIDKAGHQTYSAGKDALQQDQSILWENRRMMMIIAAAAAADPPAASD